MLIQPTILPQIFGSEYNDDLDNTVSVSTSETWTEKLSISPTNIPAGRYRLEVSYMWNHDAINNNFEARVQQGDTTDLFNHRVEPSEAGGTFGATGTDQKYPVTKVIILDLGAGSYQFDFDFRTDTAGDESSVWDASMTFWRLT